MSRTAITVPEALAWLAETFGEAPGTLTEKTPREQVPAWDSLGVLALMAGLDERFGIRITEKEIGALTSVRDILDLLRRNGALAAG